MANTKIAVLIEDLFEDSELIYPYYRLLEAGFETVLLGPKVKQYHSKHNLVMKSQLSIDDVTADDFNGVVVPGGYAPDRLRINRKIVNLVKDLYNRGKLVAAICHGPWMLASADIIRNKKLTSALPVKDDMVHAGGLWQDAAVVVDGNIITSRWPPDLPDFMREVVKFLQK